MRRNHDQIHFLFRRDANNFGGRIAVHDHFFDVEAGALFALSQLWQLTLSRIFELFTNVCNRHRIGEPGVADGGHYRLDDVNANDLRLRRARDGRRVRQRIIRTAAEVRRQQNLLESGEL